MFRLSIIFQVRSAVLFLIVLSIAFGVASDAHAQGRLSRVRNNVRKHDAPRPAKPKSHRDDSHNDEDDDHDDRHHRPRRRRHRHGGSGSGHATFLTAHLFDDHYHQPPVVEHIHIYEPAPVVVHEPMIVSQPVLTHPSSGYIEDEALFIQPSFESYFSQWSNRLSGFVGNDFDGLSHGNFGLLLQSPGGFGLDTSVTMFRENDSSFRDHLWVGDINLVYEVINFGDVRARMGVGMNWLGDSYGGEAGGNLTFGVDWQVSSRLVFTGETDFGSLGDTDLFHAQASLGIQFDRAEWATGYNHYDIGGQTVGGLFTGLRFRF